MKKAFRDIKRGVNKKVLKVPSIEQKVLDATSNEPWGPHGTHLADIAQASRNYHEYQMIISVVWKRLNDTGKNWRHVYKALTVLEYLVANGSERVIEDIREHAYQISTLSSFQYIDTTGRDQGSNIRKKSQSLVALVNDKEKIQEAREKAAVSRDKFRNTAGGPDDDRYEGRYGSRDEDLNGYGREREWGYKDPYARDGEDRSGRDGYRDDVYRGRSGSSDGDYGPRSRSSDRERGYEDDGRHSSRGSNARVEDGSPDGSRIEPTASGQNLGAPPSYEDVVSESRSPDNTPPPASNHQETTVSSNHVAPPPPGAATPPAAVAAPPAIATPLPPAVTSITENEGFDLFDPRGAPSVAPPASGGGAAVEMDLLGSLSDSFPSSELALVPSEPQAPPPSNPGHTFVAASPASGNSSQPFDDPFGDGPFKAIPSTDGFSAQPPPSPFTATAEPPLSDGLTSVYGNNSGFRDTFDQTIDILADILPPSAPSQSALHGQPDQLSTHPVFHSQTGQPSPQPFSQTGYPAPPTLPSSFPNPFGQTTLLPSFSSHGDQTMQQPGFPPQGVQSIPQSSFPSQGCQPMQQLGFPPQGVQSIPQPSFSSQGSQPMQQPGFPPQGVQSIPQPSFPSQGSQPMQQPGFPPQGAQSIPQPSFPSQGGQPMQQPGFPPQGPSFPSQGGQPMQQPRFPPQGAQSIPQPSFPSQGGQPMQQPGFLAQGGQPVMHTGFGPHGGQNASHGGYSSQSGSVPQAGFPGSSGQPAQSNNSYARSQLQGLSEVTTTPAPQYNGSNFYQQQQLQSSSLLASSQPAMTASTGALAIVPQQPANEKFETKSTVWADTLNRGLVNLNISGSKTNPLSDIGIDFEAINRKEKRMEKPSKTPVTSNVTMGKAMGSGSGMGRAGAGALRPAPNPMVGSGMGPTMGGPGYGSVNQPMGMNNMPQNMGVGMNNGQGFPMQQPPPAAGFLPGTYHPMMGRGGGYGQQQPYGGYR